MTSLKAAEEERFVAGWAPLAGSDPLAGAERLGTPSVYWERPLARECIAGWREAGVLTARDPAGARADLARLFTGADLDWLTPPPSSLLGPWFGGLRFAAMPREDAIWGPLGHGRWVLPELLVWRHGEGLCAAAFAQRSAGGEDAVRARLERVAECFPAGYRHSRATRLVLDLDASRSEFEHRVERALSVIASGQLQKVVLARPLDVEAPEAFDVVEVLSRLREENPRCATFLVRGTDGTAFVGATPETLCRIEGGRLDTEALAGSTDPSQSEALSGRDKDRREHSPVVEGILAALRPLSIGVQAEASPSILALKNVVHLRTAVTAELAPGVGIAEAVAALHPTPAVGGSPRREALQFLLEHEGLDRGWYAGPVGWIGSGRAHLAVALRSALLRGARARLFIGAGIVAGSNPAAEWKETELKSLTMLRALGGTDAGR